MNKAFYQQSGFSLIEILVSLLVLSVGLLGMGGLQVATVKGSSNAHYRTSASLLATSLAARMRANVAGVKGGYYGDTIPDCPALSLSQCKNSFTHCSSQQLAKYDLVEIKCGAKIGSHREGGVQNLLPNGKISIACTDGCNKENAVHDITITWNESQVIESEDVSVSTISVPVIP